MSGPFRGEDDDAAGDPRDAVKRKVGKRRVSLTRCNNIDHGDEDNEDKRATTRPSEWARSNSHNRNVSCEGYDGDDDESDIVRRPTDKVDYAKTRIEERSDGSDREKVGAANQTLPPSGNKIECPRFEFFDEEQQKALLGSRPASVQSLNRLVGCGRMFRDSGFHSRGGSTKSNQSRCSYETPGLLKTHSNRMTRETSTEVADIFEDTGESSEEESFDERIPETAEDQVDCAPTSEMSFGNAIVRGFGDTPSMLAMKLSEAQAKSGENISRFLNFVFKEEIVALGVSHPLVDRGSFCSLHCLCVEPRAKLPDYEQLLVNVESGNERDEDGPVKMAPVVVVDRDVSTRLLRYTERWLEELAKEGRILEPVRVDLLDDESVSRALCHLKALCPFAPIPASLIPYYSGMVDVARINERRSKLEEFERERYVLRLNPDTFFVKPDKLDRILMLPRIYTEQYVDVVAASYAVDRERVHDCLDDGILCSDALVQLMKNDLQYDDDEVNEDTFKCLLSYFNVEGSIVRIPPPKVFKSGRQMKQWFFNPFQMKSRDVSVVLPEVEKDSLLLSVRIKFVRSQPSDCFHVLTSALHEFCTPHTITVNGTVSWARCGKVRAIIQKCCPSSEIKPLIYDNDEEDLHAIYISAFGPPTKELEVWTMISAIKESVENLLKRWVGLERSRDYDVEVSCPEVVTESKNKWKTHGANWFNDCADCGRVAEIPKVLAAYDEKNQEYQEQQSRARGKGGAFGLGDGRKCPTGHGSESDTDSDMLNTGRRESGYSTLERCAFPPSLEDSPEENVSDSERNKKTVPDSRMGIQELQLCFKYMSMNSICCLGRMSMNKNSGETELSHVGTGILVDYDDQTGVGLVLTANHVVEVLYETNRTINAFLSFDYKDSSSRPSHTVEHVIYQNEDLDYAFLEIQRCSLNSSDEDLELSPLGSMMPDPCPYNDKWGSYWKEEHKLIQIGHSCGSANAAEMCLTENRLSYKLSRAIHSLDHFNAPKFPYYEELQKKLTRRDKEELKKIAFTNLFNFGNKDFEAYSNSDRDFEEETDNLLNLICQHRHPFFELRLLLQSERFLLTSVARWGASGSPIIDAAHRGGVVVGMFLGGFPDSATRGKDFLVEQALKLQHVSRKPERID